MKVTILLLVLVGMAAADSKKVLTYSYPALLGHASYVHHAAAVPALTTTKVIKYAAPVVKYSAPAVKYSVAPAAVQYSAPSAVQYAAAAVPLVYRSVPTAGAYVAVRKVDFDDDDDDYKSHLTYGAAHVIDSSSEDDSVATAYGKFDFDDHFDLDDHYDRK